MRAHDYLTELAIGKDADIEKLFNQALKQVFASSYLTRIESTIKKRIKIKEVKKNTDEAAAVVSTNIIVFVPKFYQEPKIKQISILLHEFIHVMQQSKSIGVFSKFKEIKTLTWKLERIAKRHLKPKMTIGDFLLGKKMKKKYTKKEEILSYLMNNDIKWNALTPIGKKFFIQELQKSGLFNLTHKFWTKRLS